MRTSLLLVLLQTAQSSQGLGSSMRALEMGTRKRRLRSPVFRCKQFSVDQSGCAMKVGTDAMLLGSWASVNAEETQVQDKTRRALDIGTGTGILALMLAQQYPHLRFDAVEIEAAAAAQARRNVEASPYRDRVRVHESPIQQWVADNEAALGSQMQLVVSNPPFFSPLPSQSRATEGHAEEKHARRTARSTAELPHAGQQGRLKGRVFGTGMHQHES